MGGHPNTRPGAAMAQDCRDPVPGRGTIRRRFVKSEPSRRLLAAPREEARAPGCACASVERCARIWLSSHAAPPRRPHRSPFGHYDLPWPGLRRGSGRFSEINQRRHPDQLERSQRERRKRQRFQQQQWCGRFERNKRVEQQRHGQRGYRVEQQRRGQRCRVGQQQQQRRGGQLEQRIEQRCGGRRFERWIERRRWQRS